MRVRKAATKALGKIGDPKAIAPLIGIIYEYINYMLYMLDLVRFITDKDVDTQAKHLWTFHAAIGAREAAEALGRIGAPEAADPLIDLLSVNQEMIDTVTTLDGIGSDQRKTLTTVLHEIQFQIARPTAKALGQIGAPKAVNLLIALLSCSGNLVRTEAADALGEIGDARAVNPLISLLPRHSYNIDVRWDAVAAAEALGKIGDSRAVGPLIDLISGRDDRWDDLVRCTAIRALGKIGDARAIDSLAQHLSDVSLCSPGMQAAQALRRVLGLGAIPLLVKHLFSKHFSSTNVVETLIDISRQQRLRIFLDGSYTKVS
jgi:HEAT repeat protein